MKALKVIIIFSLLLLPVLADSQYFPWGSRYNGTDGLAYEASILVGPGFTNSDELYISTGVPDNPPSYWMEFRVKGKSGNAYQSYGLLSLEQTQQLELELRKALTSSPAPTARIN